MKEIQQNNSKCDWPFAKPLTVTPGFHIYFITQTKMQVTRKEKIGGEDNWYKKTLFIIQYEHHGGVILRN